MTLLTVNAVKAHTIADDGKVTVTIDAKHVGELSVLIPANCVDPLISALTEAKSKTGGTPVRQRQPAATPPKTADHVTFKVPKNWLITADLQVRKLVLLVFDHQSDAQAGYALDAEAAKKMAGALVKSGDAVLAKKAETKN